MRKLSAVAELRSMLRQMEHDIGIEQLSGPELDVLLSAEAATKTAGDTVTSDEIRGHVLSSRLPVATFHRALRSLVSMDFIAKAEGRKTGMYIVNHEKISNWEP